MLRNATEKIKMKLSTIIVFIAIFSTVNFAHATSLNVAKYKGLYSEEIPALKLEIVDEGHPTIVPSFLAGVLPPVPTIACYLRPDKEKDIAALDGKVLSMMSDMFLKHLKEIINEIINTNKGKVFYKEGRPLNAPAPILKLDFIFIHLYTKKHKDINKLLISEGLACPMPEYTHHPLEYLKAAADAALHHRGFWKDHAEIMRRLCFGRHF